MPKLESSTSEFASSPASPVTNAWVPQFTNTEYGKTPSSRCQICNQSIYSQYFRVNARKVCSVCAEQARSGVSTASRGSLVGAFTFGCASALLLGLLYAGVGLSVNLAATLFGLVISRILTGLIIGKTAMAGASNLGGFRIQCVAALLTYSAITLQSIPAYLLATWNHPGVLYEWAAALPEKIVAGLTSPFANVTTTANALTGLGLLLLSIAIAWRLTRVQRLTVDGPFDSNPVG